MGNSLKVFTERNRRREKGLCIQCPAADIKPSEIGKSLCEYHLKKQREYNKKLRDKKAPPLPPLLFMTDEQKKHYIKIRATLGYDRMQALQAIGIKS